MNSQKVAAVCAMVFVASLFILGRQPIAVGLVLAPWDKLAHVAAFATLSMLLRIALRPHPIWYALAIAAGVGVLDEVHQLWLPGRHADWADLAADGVGILLAYVVCRK